MRTLRKRLDQDAAAQRKLVASEVAITRMWGPKRRRRRVLPKQLPQKSIAVEYGNQLKALFKLAFEAYRPLLDAIKRTTVRKDASEDFDPKVKKAARPIAAARNRSGEFSTQLKLQGREAKRLLDEAEARLEATFSVGQAESLASKFAVRTSTYQRIQLGRQVRSALGADPFMRDTVLAGVTEDYVAQNVSLIKRIPKRLHERIEGLVMNSVGKGQLNIDLGKEIARQVGISERHAKFIARDQLAKYYGAVNKARQQELGVTKFIWRTVNDERVRDSHHELNEQVFSWDDLPTNERDEEIYPGSDYQCFPGSTLVSTDAAVLKLYRRWYSGESTILTTDEGTTLETTPNHPVLTNRGWLPAKFVDVGDYVFEASLKGGQVGMQDGEHGVTTIQEVFDTLAPLGVTQVVSPVIGWFHGDAPVDEQVDVVDIHGGLRLEGDPEFSHAFCQELLVLADDAPSGQSALATLFDRSGESSRRFVSLGCKLATLLGAGRGHTFEHRSAAISWLDSVSNKLIADGLARDLEVLRETLNRPPVQEVQGPDVVTRVVVGIVRGAIVPALGDNTPGAEVLAKVVRADTQMSSGLGERVRAEQVASLVQQSYREYPGACESTSSTSVDPPGSEPRAERASTDPQLQCDLLQSVGLKEGRRVVKKVVGNLSCHVYNLETSSGWYVAEGLAVHNCRCTAEPVLDDILDDVDEAEESLQPPTFEDFDENEEIEEDPEQDE